MIEKKFVFRPCLTITDTASVAFAPTVGAKRSISVKPIQALV
jgi:hypothetical protein